MIAFNVNLESNRIEIAKTIARSVRASSGGLPCVKALGLYLSERGQAQVSMNLTDYRTTPVVRVFERVSAEARRLGTAIAGSEIVGLIPRDALPDNAIASLKLMEFGEDKFLEVNVRKKLGGDDRV